MHNFVLIDLYSQREAVLSYVKNLPRSEIFAWIKRYGEVQTTWAEIHKVGDVVIENKSLRYIFLPHVCRYLPTIFRFEEDDLLIDVPPHYYR